MPPIDRLVPRFAAEPPQDPAPEGAWAQRLQQEFLSACLRIETGGEVLGEPGELAWHPDRTWHGRTFVPITAQTSTDLELYGYVSFTPGYEEEEPGDFFASADFTTETADANPDWRIDLCDEVIGGWRGEHGRQASMTLVWGRPLVDGGAVATAELAGEAVDQCVLVDGRFTLIAPDDYLGDTLSIALYGRSGSELARESLYADDEDGEDDEA